MTPRRYGPLQYVPITRRTKLTWPGGARIALWVNPNIEFFALDDVMPGNLNERNPREHAQIPNVRNWAVRDYGNRVGIWRIMEVLTRYGIRASAALNSEVCDHHPEIIEEARRLDWELIGHNQTNAQRLTEMDEAQERDAVRATIDHIQAASGKRPVGWLGAGLAETWNTLDYLAEADIRYVCDWVNDDQPYLFEIGNPPLVSLPYSVQTNDVPAYFEMKVSVPEFEGMLRR
jgi:allantoinase